MKRNNLLLPDTVEQRTKAPIKVSVPLSMETPSVLTSQIFPYCSCTNETTARGKQPLNKAKYFLF